MFPFSFDGFYVLFLTYIIPLAPLPATITLPFPCNPVKVTAGGSSFMGNSANGGSWQGTVPMVKLD